MAKAKAKPKKKAGRPRVTFEWDELNKLCSLQCTLIEIAYFFGCSVDTIERRVKSVKNETFADYYKKASSEGKISLRRAQYNKALEGNVPMLIWLGKNALGQSDRSEQTNIEFKPIKVLDGI